MFGFGKKKRAGVVHLLMDANSHILAKGELENSLEDANLQIRIVEGQTDSVVNAEVIQVVPPGISTAVMLGRVIFRRGNQVVLEPMRKLGSQVRRHFRMPVNFESLAYPKEGGRWRYRSIDLSCGGIAFYCAAPFEPGEVPELVIPITSEGPLLVDAEILRADPVQDPPAGVSAAIAGIGQEAGTVRRYAARFPDLIHDQEAMLQEAVFNVQIESIQNARK